MGAKGSKRRPHTSSSYTTDVLVSTTTPPAPDASSASPATALWEWADDSQVFRAYDAAATATLEAAFAAGQTAVTLIHGSHQYAVDLAGLQQTNTTTNYSRAIRRNPAFATAATATATATTTSLSGSSSGSSSSYTPTPTSADGTAAAAAAAGPVWEFEKEDGEWEAYDKLTTRLLEGSLTNGRANVVLNHGSFAVPGGYMVDFVGLTQTKQQSAHEVVRVRRTPAIDPLHYPAIAQAIAKAAAKGGDDGDEEKSSGKEKEKAFSDVGKGKLREVGKLTRWARVTDKLIPEETCPVCLCEFEQEEEEGKEEEEEEEGKGKEAEADGKKKDASKKKKKSKKQPKEKAIEDEADDVIVRLSQCQGHYFHRDCIVHCFKSGFLQCPICNVVYGVRIGTMPEGTMNVSTSGPSLSGFEDCGTIQIDYYFSSGIQGPEHPNPGMSYGGTSRTAYLPDNKEGQEILKLFKIAWERRLLFTVGRSVTTGEDNQVVWGGVHQKTCTSGGATSFGYPDPTYFERVKAELAAKGVHPE